MTNGPLVSRHFPYLPLTLTVRNQTVTVEALLDTGFDGDVVVPKDLITNGTPPDSYVQWVLADGSVVQAPAYLGTVQVGPFGPTPCVISVLGDETIIGRSVTDRFSITLDHAQWVIVAP